MRIGLAFAAGAVLFLGPGEGSAELRANVAITSNYIWRGITQSDDSPAVSAGIDYAHPGGFFAGLWTSSISGKPTVSGSVGNGEPPPEEVNGEYELDLYAGYRWALRPVAIEAGYITYIYPRGDVVDLGTGRTKPNTDNSEDFQEVYLGASYKLVRANVYYSDNYRNTGEISRYVALEADIPLQRDLALGLHWGYMKSGAIDDTQNRLGDYRISLTKGPFTLAVTDLTDNEDALQSHNPRVAVSWRHDFEF